MSGQTNQLTPEDHVQVQTTLRALREQFRGLEITLVLAAMNMLIAELIDGSLPDERKPRFLASFSCLLRQNLERAAKNRLAAKHGTVH